MEIGSIAHKGLRKLFEDGDPSRLDARAATKILVILAFIQDMAGVDELKTPPKWGAHLLTGDRAGTWSLTVTRNWRLTFKVDADDVIQELDFEDYH